MCCKLWTISSRFVSLVEDSSGSKVFREREFSPASFLFVRVSVSVFEILLEARVLKLRTRKGTNLSCDVDESFLLPFRLGSVNQFVLSLIEVNSDSIVIPNEIR